MNSGSIVEPSTFTVGVVSLHSLKKQYLAWILTLADGNKAQAARLLDIDRSSLYRILRSCEPRSPSPAPCVSSLIGDTRSRAATGFDIDG